MLYRLSYPPDTENGEKLLEEGAFFVAARSGFVKERRWRYSGGLRRITQLPASTSCGPCFCRVKAIIRKPTLNSNSESIQHSERRQALPYVIRSPVTQTILSPKSIFPIFPARLTFC